MSFESCRKSASLTQAEVSKVLGVSQSCVHAWESGKWRPRAALLTEIARLYGCTVDELLSNEKK